MKSLVATITEKVPEELADNQSRNQVYNEIRVFLCVLDHVASRGLHAALVVSMQGVHNCSHRDHCLERVVLT